ncbi:cytosine methyltransferase [Flavobacteriaceae bacterium (ex Bugula neritina AB1)]|nr:cytosine methyltransferase [Flavobacteriaceae bacterium (ex Bugula neritina AB1)]
MELRKGRHVVYMIHAHLIFVTKYRGKVFTDESLQKMEELMAGICENHEAKLTEFNGEADHVHLLIEYPPKVALSVLVNALKGITSRELKRYFPELNQPAWKKNALWSPSYFAGSVGGAPLEVLKNYIDSQARPS